MKKKEEEEEEDKEEKEEVVEKEEENRMRKRKMKHMKTSFASTCQSHMKSHIFVFMSTLLTCFENKCLPVKTMQRFPPQHVTFRMFTCTSCVSQHVQELINEQYQFVASVRYVNYIMCTYNCVYKYVCTCTVEQICCISVQSHQYVKPLATVFAKLFVSHWSPLKHEQHRDAVSEFSGLCI